jgi:hypothetical protein
MTKEEAIFKILRVLKSAMMIMSPAKKEALTLAEEHGITVADLISEYEKIAMRV